MQRAERLNTIILLFKAVAANVMLYNIGFYSILVPGLVSSRICVITEREFTSQQLYPWAGSIKLLTHGRTVFRACVITLVTTCGRMLRTHAVCAQSTGL